MKIVRLLQILGFSSLLSGGVKAQVILSDNFDDEVNTGWTYLNRNGAEEIADAMWVETGGRLEQQTDNYDFPRDTTVNDPVLGAIALAPQSVGGHYKLSAVFTSLEPGNGFQDQDFVFGYVDADNFFLLETINSGGLNVFTVVDGDRTTVDRAALTFNESATTVTLEHNAETGDVIVTYGAEAPVSFNDPAFIRSGANRVGVGSNNDAFAIDDFSINQITVTEEKDPEITDFQRDSESGEVTVTWTSELDVLYTISRSFDLKFWDDIEDSVIGQTGTTDYEDTPTGDTVFYRVRKTAVSP